MNLTIKERVRRFFMPTEELEASELREQAKDCGAQQLGECQLRSKVTLRGTITALTSDTHNARLEADLSDGSGTVQLIWMGRTHLDCVAPGSTLRVSGRLAGDVTQPVIYNPAYEVIGSAHSSA